ncbi:DUF3050 domain-containing protein [Pseudomonas rhodesiae]|uniref:DUF3050 domain-containing protein n=1 Tax=Pseudomonas rhodesiae TaxID=76760 RepID=UPI00209D0412|nr:DUF3050 domain-containing protein [Pseudomonas rhodesiae]
MHQLLLEQKKQQLCAHPLFKQITSLNKLQLFMESHVFAVWDFMTITKRLQRELTCIQLPWLPPANPQAARLINEIVLAEESDTHPRDGHCSHFELYLEAMCEIGANANAINRFMALLRQGVAPITALHEAKAPSGARRFVSDTLRVALNAPTHCVAAVFLHGRERVIPSIFERLLLADALIEDRAPILCAYLRRHIELDAQDHAPAAERLLRQLTDAHPTYAQQANETAIVALDSRITFWDEVQVSLQEVRP